MVYTAKDLKKVLEKIPDETIIMIEEEEGNYLVLDISMADNALVLSSYKEFDTLQ